MLKLEQHWYRPSLTLLTFFCLPLAWLFGFVVAVRRFLYRICIKKIICFPVPIIIVGNITVGGTGKTPFVIWLAKKLQEKGFNPGIVTRGIGGIEKQEPRWVTANSLPKEVGDEAILLVRRTTCPVVIGIDRVAAVKELLAKKNCDIVISDDGLQHYRLGRDIEIAMIDGIRKLGNKQLIPAGPLRENIQRLNQVDFIVQQDENISENKYAMKLEGTKFVSVNNEQQCVPLDYFKNKTAHAIAAIGHPARFFSVLRAAGIQIIEHTFRDHYLYKSSDLQFDDNLPILMTEKDAVKCKQIATKNCWFLPVSAAVDEKLILELIRKLYV